MPTFNRNTEKNGLEISFEGIPDESVRTELKNNGFRWHRANKFWYAKETPERLGELLIQASVWMDDQTQERSFPVKMGIRYIIEEICNAAEEFYDSWNDKAAFDDHVVSFTEYSTENNRTRGN